MEQVIVEGSKSLLDYGVLGIVVLALGSFAAYLFKNYMAESKKRITVLEAKMDAHEKELKDTKESHGKELRELWEHDSKREAASTAALERNTEAMEGMTSAINELRFGLAKLL